MKKTIKEILCQDSDITNRFGFCSERIRKDYQAKIINNKIVCVLKNEEPAMHFQCPRLGNNNSNSLLQICMLLKLEEQVDG